MEEVGLELELAKAEAFISNAKNAQQALDGLNSSLRSFLGMSSSNNALDVIALSAQKFFKAGQDAAKAAGDTSSKLSDLGGKAQSGVSPVANLGSGLVSLGSHAASLAAEGLGKVSGIAGGALISSLESAFSSIGKISGKLLEMGTHAATTAAKFGVGFGKDSVKAAMEFDQKISEVAAVSGATSKELDQMNDKALELGAKFPVSASDAADAMGELAKAGFTAKDAIAASEGVVQLSSATHYKMGESAEYLASAMNLYGLKTEDSTQNVKNALMITDLFAASANASAVDVKDLAKTLEYAGPAAQAAGFSIQDTAKAAAVLGNAGIKGSSAGTGLKTILSQLAEPSDKATKAFEALGYSTHDAAGNIKPLQQQLVELRAKFQGLKAEDKIDFAQKIAGKDHFTKLLAIMNTTDASFRQVSDSIDNADGAGKRMAATMNDNLAGAVENLKGSLETFQIKTGKAFEPLLKDAANFGSDLINKAGPALDRFVSHIQGKYEQLHAGISGKPLIQGNEIVITPFTKLGDSIRFITKALSDLFSAISGKNPLKAIGESAANLQSPIEIVANGLMKLSGFIEKNIGKISDFVKTVGDLAGKFITVYEALNPFGMALNILQGFMTGGLSGGLKAFGDSFTHIGQMIQEALPEILKAINTISDTIGKWITDEVPKLLAQLGTWGEQFVNWIGPQLPKLIEKLGVFLAQLVGWIGDQAVKVIEGLAAWGAAFWQWIEPRIPGMLQELAKIAAAVTGWIITDALPAIIGKLVEWGEAFLGWVVKDVIPKLPEVLKGIWDALLTFIGDVAGKLGEGLTKWAAEIDKQVSSWAEAVGLPLDEWKAKFQGSLKAIGDMFGPILEDWKHRFQGSLQAIGDAVGPVLEDWKHRFKGSLQAIGDNFTPTLNEWKAKFQGSLKAIGDFFSDLGKTISDVWNGVKTAVTDTWNGLLSFIQGVVNKVIAAWNGLVQMIQNGAEAANLAMSGDFGGAFDALSGKTEAFRKDFGSKMTDIGKTLLDKGKDMQGSLNETGKSMDDVKDKAGPLATSIDKVSSSSSNATGPINNAGSAADSASGKFDTYAGSVDTTTGNLNTYNQTEVKDKQATGNWSDYGSSVDGATGKLTNYNNTKIEYKTAETNAVNIWDLAREALARYNSTPVVAKNIGGGVSAYAGGTDYHPGGPALVADEGPEIVKQPGTPPQLFERPTFLQNLARGSKVLDSFATRAMIKNSVTVLPASAQQIYNQQRSSVSSSVTHHNERSFTLQQTNYGFKPDTAESFDYLRVMTI